MESTSPFVNESEQLMKTFALKERSSSFALRISERKLLLAFGDLLILNLALLVLAALSVSELTFTWAGLWDRAIWFVVISTIWFIFGAFFSVYDLAIAASPLRSAWSVGTAAFLTSSIYLLIPFYTPSLPDRRIYIFAFPLIVTGGIVLWRLFYSLVFVQPVFHQRTLVIGAGRAGTMLADVISRRQNKTGNPYEGTGYKVVGFVDDDPAKQNTLVAGVPVLGTSDNLVELVNVIQPDELVLAITWRQAISPELFKAIMDCREMGISVTMMTELYELIAGRLPVEHAGNNLDVMMPMQRSAMFRIYLAGRRFFDVLLALLGTLFLGILIPFVWLANRFTDPGDLFYRQERVGLGGKPFEVIKFRSMVMNAENVSGAVWANEDDPRITPVGQFLRKTRLDEVPQFWNVLKGDMSLIGPRPERPFFVQQLAQDIPFYRMRHAVKPGITGWAQVKYRYGASKEDSLVKLEYDLYYIKNQSAFLDMQILIKTIQVTLGLKGR